VFEDRPVQGRAVPEFFLEPADQGFQARDVLERFKEILDGRRRLAINEFYIMPGHVYLVNNTVLLQ
jgi:hypothetical protein